MDSMVERVARALANEDGINVNNDARYSQSTYRPRARSAIRAMLEPTPAMIDRFVSRALCVSIHGDGGWSNYAREQWQTMVQAALSDTEGR